MLNLTPHPITGELLTDQQVVELAGEALSAGAAPYDGKLLTTDQVATLCGYKHATYIVELIDAGKLPAVKHSPRRWLVKASDALRLRDTRSQHGGARPGAGRKASTP